MRQRVSLLIDALRLPRFHTKGDEEAFWLRHDARRLEFRKFFILCSIFTYCTLGLLDVVAGGDAVGQLLAIRAGGLIAIVAIFVRFCRPCTPTEREILISLIGFVVVTSLSWMILIGPERVAQTYPFIISAAMIYGNCLLVPRFYTQAAFCVMVAVIYWPTTLFVQMPAHVYFTNAFVIWITTLSVLVGALVREKLQREHAINEANLWRAIDDALKANRAKSHLLANVSHELRTPLNAIIGFSEMMENEVFGPIEQEKYRQYAKDIHFSGKLLHANINDLLDLSRLEVDKMHWSDEYFSLTETLRNVIATCAPEEKSIQVVLSPRLQNVSMTMFADRDRMSQVFINIITNAMKFSGPNTSIQISFGLAKSGAVTLRIADQGIGISPSDLEKILEPFNQVNQNSYIASNTGLGLGLSIVSGILERCDSTLSIESDVGRGTTVSIHIPPERITVSSLQKRRGLTRFRAFQKAS